MSIASGEEHCLVGIKGNPKLNRNLDCDVIVSEAPDRQTRRPTRPDRPLATRGTELAAAVETLLSPAGRVE